jgi:formylglycine-generating enzyme required for sulfatase activity
MRLTFFGKLILIVLGLAIVFFSIRNFAPDLYTRLAASLKRRPPAPPANATPGSSPAAAAKGDLVTVPAGSFRSGSDRTERHLGAFRIAKTEVTNRQYLTFLGACAVGSECGPRELPHYWDDAGYLDTHLEFPVVFVSWGDASAYCRHTGGRLPSILEWEKAARGSDGRMFPWGDTLDFEIPNILGPEKHGDKNKAAKQIPTWAVTDPRLARDASPYGALGMAGNVSEWTATASENEPNLMLIAGGSWDSWDFNDGRAYHRVPKSPTDRSSSVGFRCAADAR